MVDDASRSYGCTLFKLKTGAPHIKTTHPLKPILSQIISYYLKRTKWLYRSRGSAGAVYPSHSATSTVSIAEMLLRAPGWQQAGGWARCAHLAAQQTKISFFFVSFQNGLHEACGAKGVNFFFLFRMFFLNITGFSLVCWGLKYFFFTSLLWAS